MVPVAVGAAVAWAAETRVVWSALVAALIASALIQLGTNLHNDAADWERGGDGPDRIGPKRATASGLLSAAAVNRGAIACFGLAALMGFYLIYAGGWPILVLGCLAIVSGWGYTGGPFPIAYTPLGEVFVIVFFGLVAVGGTYLLCTGHVTAAALVAGLAVGALAAAVLLVNNHRDAKSDFKVGRRTLPIVAGARMTPWIYAALVALPFALLPLIAREIPRGHVWPALVALPLAAALIRRFAVEPRGPVFNQVMVQTVQLQLLYSALLALGLVL